MLSWRRLLLFCLCWAAGAQGRESITVIEAYYRPAQELAALIQPLLGPSETVAASGNQLILKASPERVAEIQGLLAQIDRSPHRLRITVIQGSHLTRDSLNASLGLEARIGSGGAAVGGVGHAYQLEGRDSLGATQQVQTLDGASASIEVGAQLPVPVAPSYGYGYGGIAYQPATTGFSVTPRLMGGQVLIEIDPWSERPSREQGGFIATQGLHTQIKAALGEWVELGGQVETTTQEQSGTLGHSYATRSQENRTFLKVEDLDAGRP